MRSVVDQNVVMRRVTALWWQSHLFCVCYCSYLFVSRFYLSLARHVCFKGCSQVPLRLQWLFTAYGHRFFVSHRWSYDFVAGSPFSSLGNRADPLAYVMRVYREHLLERALQTLLAPGGRLDAYDEEPLRRTQTSDVLTYVQLLMENAVAAGNQGDPALTLSTTNIQVACKWIIKFWKKWVVDMITPNPWTALIEYIETCVCCYRTQCFPHRYF